MKTKTLFIATIFLLLGYFAFPQTITINIISPTPNQAVTDSILHIAVQAFSTIYEISTVTASVQGRQAQLIFDPQDGYFKGPLLLAGLPQNTPLVMQVVATDVLNNQQTKSVSFSASYDLPPLLIVDSLLDGSNANPLIRIRAKVIDDNSNAKVYVKVYRYPGYLYADPRYLYIDKSFPDSVDYTFDLSGMEGIGALIILRAQDSRGQTVADTAVVTVESSHYLKKIFTSDGTIIDFNFNKVLTYKKGIKKITDILTGATTIIPDSSLLEPYQPDPFSEYRPLALLTPYGAIFPTSAGRVVWDPNQPTQLLELKNNSLYFLDSFSNGGYNYLKVAGNFASWINRHGQLNLRDLQTSTNTLVSASPVGYNDLTVNGTLVWQGGLNAPDYQIFKFINNVVTTVVTGGQNWYPLTDGKNIVYTKYSGAPLQSSLYLYDGQVESELSNFDRSSPLDTGAPKPVIGYQVNNNYIAYLKKGPTGVRQVWLRDSLGNSSQKTFYNFSSNIDLLNPKGDFIAVGKYPINLAYNIYSVNPARRYFIKHDNGQTLDISSDVGKTYYRDSTWYLAIGNSLYTIDVDGLQDSLAVLSSSIVVQKYFEYTFSQDYFPTHFKGAGSLSRVRFTSLPQNGYLKMGNSVVPLNADIPIGDLKNLIYIPFNNVFKQDSIKWTGGYGINLAPNAATISIDITNSYTSVMNGNWNNPQTWANHAIPSPDADVIIKHYVTATADATCNSLSVQSPGTFIVSPGITVTILK